MNVDVVEILMREKYLIAAGTADYELILGPSFRSKFAYGARLNMPSENMPNNRTNAVVGSWNKTHMMPLAYSELTDVNGHAPRDDYYYADFVTRIHENDPRDGTATTTLLAYDNVMARYPDGVHELIIRVTDTRDRIVERPINQDEELTPAELVIDNYKPYLKFVRIQVGDNPFGAANDIVYDGFIDVTSAVALDTHSQLTYRNFDNPNTGSGMFKSARLIFSEPVHTASIEFLQGCDNCTTTPANWGGSEGLNWTFEIHGMLAIDEEVQMRIRAFDFSGNALINLNDSLNSDLPNAVNRVGLPWRMANSGVNQWSLNPNSSHEDIHRFWFGYCPADLNVNDSRNSSFSCANLRDIYFNRTYQNIDETDGSITPVLPQNINLPLSFEWFDEDANVISTDEVLDGVSAGLYCVEVVDDACCSVRECIEIPSCQTMGLNHWIYPQCGNEANGSIFLNYLYNPNNTENQEETIELEYELNGVTHIELIKSFPHTIENLPAGELCYTFSDMNGCSQEYCHIIEHELSFDASVTIKAPCISGTNTGNISIHLNAPLYPVTPTKYVWSNGVSSFHNRLIGLAPGMYCVEVYRGECVVYENCFEVPYSRISAELLSFNQVSECILNEICGSVGCTKDGSIRVQGHGGNGPYDYSWTGPDDFSASGPQIDKLAIGEYCVTIKDRENCVLIECYNLGACETIIYNPEIEKCITLTNGNELDLQLDVSIVNGPPACGSSITSNLLDYKGLLVANWYGPDGFHSQELNLYDLCVAGEYCIEVDNGCSTQKECVILPDCAKLTMEVLFMRDYDCDGPISGEIRVVINGAPIERANISPFAPREIIGSHEVRWFGIRAGTYEIYIADGEGCRRSLEFDIREGEIRHVPSEENCDIEVWCEKVHLYNISTDPISVKYDENCLVKTITCENGNEYSVPANITYRLEDPERCLIFGYCENGEVVSTVFGTTQTIETECQKYIACVAEEIGFSELISEISSTLQFDHIDSMECGLVFCCDEIEECETRYGTEGQEIYMDIDEFRILNGLEIYCCLIDYCDFSTLGLEYSDFSFIKNATSLIGVASSDTVGDNYYNTVYCEDNQVPEWEGLLPLGDTIAVGDCSDIQLDDINIFNKNNNSRFIGGLEFTRSGVNENGVPIFKSNRMIEYLREFNLGKYKMNTIKVFPNPFTDQITIEMFSSERKEIRFTISTIDGISLLSSVEYTLEAGMNEFNLDLTNVNYTGLMMLIGATDSYRTEPLKLIRAD